MFKGSFPALVTPFRDGEIDEKALRDHVAWQIAEGSHGLVPVGTTGESPTLSHEEHKRVVEITIEAADGQVPVIAGAGSNNTRESIDFAEHAEKAGAQGLLVVTPYYNKPNQRGLYAHFEAIAKATALPIIIYNIPPRSIIDMTDETMARLYNDFDNIIGVKDATADITRISKMRGLVDRQFNFLSGEDPTVLGFMAHGG
ncbi:MAG: 4-hydroxy-tetrahydrodipicolinate synthase, partial [Pseudomonadota bacterium]